MNRTTRSTLVIAAVGALAALGAGPASAGTVCKTIDATPVYASYNSNAGTLEGYLFTLSPDRGFAFTFGGGYDGPNGHLDYLYGHGAEHPTRDGYVRAQHIRC